MGKKVVYELLLTLPFTQRKMMSVIVRNVDTQKITMISKGADSVMLKKKGETSIEYERGLESFLTKVSKMGLRTLVLAHRHLTLE